MLYNGYPLGWSCCETETYILNCEEEQSLTCCDVEKEFSELWMDLLLGGSRGFFVHFGWTCWEGGTITLIEKQNPGCCGRLWWWINIRPYKWSYLVSRICCRWTLWMKEWREELQGAMERLRERVWGLIEVQILLLPSSESLEWSRAPQGNLQAHPDLF